MMLRRWRQRRLERWLREPQRPSKEQLTCQLCGAQFPAGRGTADLLAHLRMHESLGDI
jgi:hypothetical protein